MTTKRYLQAAHRQPTDTAPIWLMRQAGRYLPEYRAIRDQHPFLDMVHNPELAAEVTLQPIRRYGFDAAIIFADILPMLDAMGLELEFIPGKGPVLNKPIRDAARIFDLKAPCPVTDLSSILEALKLTKAELPDETTLIGFSGAPFTLACYAIEGGGSKDYHSARALMHSEPKAWHQLMQVLCRAIADYADAQLQSGAEAFQLFDSWVGVLSPEVFARQVKPYLIELCAEIKARHPEAPLTYFGTGTGPIMGQLPELGTDVLGVDWRLSLTEAADLVGPDRTLQGNLDPAFLLGDAETLRSEVTRIAESMKGRPGYIFNLGHGIIKETDPDMVHVLIDAVRAVKGTH